MRMARSLLTHSTKGAPGKFRQSEQRRGFLDKDLARIVRPPHHGDGIGVSEAIEVAGETFEGIVVANKGTFAYAHFQGKPFPQFARGCFDPEHAAHNRCGKLIRPGPAESAQLVRLKGPDGRGEQGASIEQGLAEREKCGGAGRWPQLRVQAL